MKRFFISIVTVILLVITECHNLPAANEQGSSAAKTNILLPKAGYTSIKEKIIQISKKDYEGCYSATWDMKIPLLVDLLEKDIRNAVNDSIYKIVNLLLKDTLEYKNNVYEITYDCDTTGTSFSNPEAVGLYSKLGRNSERILSLNLYASWAAGQGGHGFGTNLSSFNVDVVNNKLLLINDLFNNANTKKLLKCLIEKRIEFPNETISLDESFNLFGSSEGDQGYGSYEYVGFRIENSSIIFSYSLVYSGRGNGINELELPLEDIKPFINKKYKWICKG